MKKNSTDGSAGITVLLVIAIVIVLNFLVGALSLGNARFDLTENRLYTLTEGTQNILDRISPDEPVTIRFYATDSARVMLDDRFVSHAKTVKNLLLEIQKAAPGRVILETIAANPKTEEEDRAMEDDLRGIPVNNQGDNIYLGMSVSSASKKEVLPFLNPAEETTLEYSVARAIQKVSRPEQTVVGIMSGMPLMGSPMFPFQRQRGQEPWVLVQRLRMDYEVREVPMNADKIDSDITVLLVIHPADVTEIGEYAIDQYLLKGGKVIAMVDPSSMVAERLYSNQPNPMTGQPGAVINPVSSLPNLFKSWGVGFNKDQVVADMTFRTVRQGKPDPTILSLSHEAVNSKDRITEDLQSLMMVSSGAFEVESKDGLEVTRLIESSQDSNLVDSTSVEGLLRNNFAGFTSSGRHQLLAVRLNGKFKTAFPGGKPKGPAEAKPAEGGGAQEDTTAPAPAAAAATAPAASAVAAPPAAMPAVSASTEAVKAAAAPTTPPAPTQAAAAPATPPVPTQAAAGASVVPESAPSPVNDGTLMESASNEGMVILFADADMMFDAFSVRQDGAGGMMAANSNLPLMLNAVEMLTGGGDLMKVRSRASTVRPFTKLDEMRERVEKEYRPKLQALQGQLDEIAQKMGPLRMKSTGEIVATPEQIREIDKLKETQVKINKDIREIEKEQRREIDYIESIITLLNVAGVPLLVIIVGVILAWRRRITTAAV